MMNVRSKGLIIATIVVWLTAYLAWTADRVVMPYPLDADRTVRRFIICCVGIACCWPIFACLEKLKPTNWRARAMWGFLLGCGASVAIVLANVVTIYAMNPKAGYLSLAEGVQIFMGVCWVFFLWITLYFNIIAEAEKRAAERKLAEVAQAELRTQYMALASQVHPHFLFNTLNTISGLIMEGNPARAEKVVMSLASLLRQSLETDLGTLTTLGEEMVNVRRYLTILEARFENRFETIEDLPPELMSALIPPMMLQPLVENVFQHGVSTTSAKVRLTLRARRTDDTLVIQVIDDAQSNVGAVQTGGTGIGQNNIQKRLELLYEGAASLSCTLLRHGYESSLSLPWREHVDA